MAKRIILIVVALLVIILAISAIGFATDGFNKNTDKWGIREVNEKNFIKASEYTVKNGALAEGLNVTVSNNGEITVNGKNNSSVVTKIEVQNVTLGPGTYTFSSGSDKTSTGTYFMSMEKSGGTESYTADFVGQCTFTLDAETEFVVYICVQSGIEINTTFKPVIVEGESAGSFYVTAQ